MANMIYPINKGINKPVEFRGLKAQYIWYLGGGVLGLMVLFAILYIIGLNSFICLGIVGIIGTGLFMWVYRLSNRYGEHGMTKMRAKQAIPRVIKNNSRKVFMKK